MKQTEWRIHIRRLLGIRDEDIMPEVEALLDQAWEENPPYVVYWMRVRLRLIDNPAA